MSRKLPEDLTKKMLQLYNKVGQSSFFSHAIKDTFPSTRVHVLSCRGYIKKTGNTTVVNGHKFHEWYFSKSGISFIESYQRK